MAGGVKRGEIWVYAVARPDKQRPVQVLTRQEVIDLLNTVMVEPVTSRIRGAPSEVIVGAEEGLKHDSAVNLDHVQTVKTARLSRRIGHLSPQKMSSVCHALAIATGCREGVAPDD